MEDRVEGNVLLSIANKCVRLIPKRHGVDIDIYSFPLDDPKVYDLIKADTSSDVFGLESHMMQCVVNPAHDIRYTSSCAECRVNKELFSR